MASLINKPSYIDIFKRFKVMDFENLEKSGNVKLVQDQIIGRKVISITGDVSAKNFIQFPKKMSALKSLDLYGKYIYLLGSFPLGTVCSFSFEIKSDGKIYELHFSNLYKLFKIKEYQLQIPLRIFNNKWSVIAIDLVAFLSCSKINNLSEFALHTFKINANILIKNIVCSNTLFEIDSFPTELRFKTQKNETFCDSYNFILIQNNKQEIMSLINEKKPKQDYSFKNQIRNIPKKSKETKENDNNINLPIPSDSNCNDISRNADIKNPKSILKNKSVRFKPTNIFLVEKDDLMPIPESSPPLPILKNEIPNNFFELEPTPIMKLSNLHGYSGLLKTLKMIDEENIIYSLGNKIISYNTLKKKQILFFGHKENVTNLCLAKKIDIMVSSDSKYVFTWFLSTSDKICSFNTGLKSILSIEFGFVFDNLNIIEGMKKKRNDKRNLNYKIFIAGYDEKNRSMIQIYSSSEKSNHELEYYHKQLSDFDIQILKFIDNDDCEKGLVTMGHDNIRIWKLKDGGYKVLTGSNILLSNFVKGTILTDLIIINETNISQGVISTNLGNVYVVDLLTKSMIALFKISDNSIVKMSYQSELKYIVCSFEDAKITVWTNDFSENILEGKLESQSLTLEFLRPDALLCGCINGTVGILNIRDKKFINLIRTHNEEISFIDYNKVVRKLITVAFDCTVRIWSVEKDVLDQIYEFRCLDEEITSLATFRNKPWFICGSKRGVLRVFDLINFSLLWENTTEINNEITSFDINSDDSKILISNTKGESVNLLISILNDGSFESSKLFPQTNMRNIQLSRSSGFDPYNRFLYIVSNSGYTINFYSNLNFSLVFNIDLSEQLSTCYFSYHPSDFFIVDIKGSFYRYDVNYSRIEFSRQYSKLHDDKIFDIIPSGNCEYFVSVGSDNFIKVWDYHFKGNNGPSFQAFTCNENINRIILSNDENRMVFAFGKDSKGLYLWKFANCIEKKGDFQIDKQATNLIKGENLICDGVDKMRSTNILPSEIKKEFDETFPEKNWKDDQEEIEVNSNKERKFDIHPEERSEKNSLCVKKQMEYTNNAENAFENEKEHQILNAESYVNNIQSLESHLNLNTILGFTTLPNENPSFSTLIFNVRLNYIGYIANSNLIITYLNESKTQKIFQFNCKFPLSSIFLSPNEQILFIISSNTKISILNATTFQRINDITKTKANKVLSFDVSPCNNYFLSIYQYDKEEIPYICIFEIASGALIASSFLSGFSMSVCSRWKPNSLEFCTIDRSNVEFWRLNSKHSLDYQRISIPNHTDIATKYGSFIALNFLRINEMHALLIGTKDGSLLIFDSRSGSLICICSQIINGPILQIESDKTQQNLYIRSSSQNIYSWDITRIDNLEAFLEVLDSPSHILALDSAITSFFVLNKTNEKAVISMTKSGILWYCDFLENATLKLMGSHISKKFIFAVELFFDPILNKRIIISASNDCSIKFWDLDNLELIVEIYLPRKECLCFDVHVELGVFAAGFSDGGILFYNYRNSKTLGNVYLENKNQVRKEELKDNRCNEGITGIKFMKGNQENIFFTTSRGDIYVIYVENWDKIKIEMGCIVENAEENLNDIILSHNDEINIWSVSSPNKILTYSRKDLSRIAKKSITDVYNVETYLIDSYKIKQTRRLEVSSNIKTKTIHKFCKKTPDCYIAINSGSYSLIIRNFREHVNVKNIELDSFPINFIQSPNEKFIYLSKEKNGISIYDYHLALEVDRKEFETVDFDAMSIWDIRNRKDLKDYVDRDETYWEPLFIAGNENLLWIWSVCN